MSQYSYTNSIASQDLAFSSEAKQNLIPTHVSVHNSILFISTSMCGVRITLYVYVCVQCTCVCMHNYVLDIVGPIELLHCN